MIETVTEAKACDPINRLEEVLAQCPQAEIPTLHKFTPGMYSRTVLMRKGNIFTSKIHRTEHQFVVSQGRCIVFDSHGNRETVQAPYLGVTKPGTRRAILVYEDCIWTTFHPTTLTDVDAIEKEIIESHAIPVVIDGSRAQSDIFADMAKEALTSECLG